MKKLRLSPDELTVESFEATKADGVRGTVLGEDSGETFQDTCQKSCYGTCKWQTCNVPWACP
ncbi:MAG TPA: hypothetical protein VF006_20195 [Longimicrobium sp.]